MGVEGDDVDDLAWHEHLGLDLLFFGSPGLGLCCRFLSSFLLRVMVMVDEGMRAMMLGMNTRAGVMEDEGYAGSVRGERGR